MKLTFNVQTFLRYPRRWQRMEKLKPLFDLNILSPSVILCGGALQVLFDPKAKVNDFDLYFCLPKFVRMDEEFWGLDAKSELNNLVHETKIKLVNLGFKCIFACPEGKLYSYKKGKVKIQLIVEQVDSKIYSDVWSIIDDFDFSCCVIATDGSKVYTLSKAVRDIRRRKLSIHKLLHPVSTMSRIGKYHFKKGYSFASVRTEFLHELNVDTSNLDMRGYID